MENIIKTSEKIAVENYPYGFKMRTTLFDEMEFNPNKGYRHKTTTVNPKTNKLNKPKCSTYSMLKIRYYDENNHIKTKSFDLNGRQSINEGLKFMNANFDLFSMEEIKYMYKTFYSMLKVDMQASVMYGGAKVEELIPLYDTVNKLMIEGYKNPLSNTFHTLLDLDAIDAKKDPNFNPFKVVTYGLD